METGESWSFLCHRKLRPMTQKTLRGIALLKNVLTKSQTKSIVHFNK